MGVPVWEETRRELSLSQGVTNHILPKSNSVGLFWSNFNHFDVVGLNATDFVEITKNNGHRAVQGYSRSPISVRTNGKPVYATSC